MRIRLLLIFMLLMWCASGYAQDTAVVVPDLTGMGVPQAAAVLHEAGLRLGEEVILPTDAEAGNPINKVVAQEPAAGESVEAHTAIAVTVPRPVNARLVYDDNDLTLVNLSDTVLDLSVIRFIDSDGPSSFAAATWTQTLPVGQCGQIWSLHRLVSKPVENCTLIHWLTSTDLNTHFWTRTNGVETFSILQNGAPRATCPAAGPGTQDAPVRCDIFLDVDYPAENTDYVYLAYTPDALVVHNHAEDRWMPVDGLRISSVGAAFVVPGGGNAGRLTPGHCLVLAAVEDAAQPEPCVAAASVQVNPASAFWRRPFAVLGRDDVPRACEAAEAGHLMICIMPR